MNKSRRYRTDQPSSLLASALNNGGAPHSELTSAWNSMHQAKSVLNRAEHKLTDMSKPSSADILWNLPDYLFSMIEHDHTQSTNDSVLATGVTRDIYQPPTIRRTVHTPKSHQSSSRVSDSRRLSNHSADNSALVADGSIISSDSSISYPASDATNGFSKPSAPHMDLSLSRISKTTSNTNKSVNSSNANETRSTAVRETGIRFLNDIEPAERPPPPVAPAARVHHVNVIVPSARGSNEALTHGKPKVTFQEPFVSSESIRNSRHSAKNEAVVASSDSESLQRIRSLVQRPQHFEADDEPSTESLNFDDEAVAQSRKVSAGPRVTVPSYAGFSEPDHKLEHTKRKQTTDNSKHVASKISKHVYTADVQQALSQRPSHTGVPSRTVAQRAAHSEKALITTRSWRAGARLIPKDVGVPAQSKSSPAVDYVNTVSSRSYQQVGSNDRLQNLVKIDADTEEPTHDERQNISRLSHVQVSRSCKAEAPDDKKKQKTHHVERYDSKEVRKYMKKCRQELHQKRLEEQEAKAKAKAEREHHLRELLRKQQEAIAASAAVAREKARKMELQQLKAQADHSEPEADGSVLNDDELSEYEESVASSQLKKQHVNRASSHVDNRTMTRLEIPKFHADADLTELSAEQIVGRFAEEAGLNLTDVVTHYSQYAQAIQQSFARHGAEIKKSKVASSGDNAKARGSHSTASRLEAICNSSFLLRSRLQQEAARFRDGLMVPVSSVGGSDQIQPPADQQQPIQSDLPGVMGPVAAGRDQQASSYRLQSDVHPVSSKWAENVSDAANRRPASAIDGRSNGTSYPRVAPEDTCPTRLTHLMPSDVPRVADAVPALKPYRPVQAWGVMQPDPYNIFSILNRTPKFLETDANKFSTTVSRELYPVAHALLTQHDAELNEESQSQLFPSKSENELELRSEGRSVRDGVADDDHDQSDRGNISNASESKVLSKIVNSASELAWSASDDVPMSRVSRHHSRPGVDAGDHSQHQAVSSAVSYRDDFNTDISESLGDRSASHAKSVSHHSKSHTLTDKQASESHGFEMVRSSSLHDVSHSETDVSEFSEISSLSTNQQVLSSSTHHHARLSFSQPDSLNYGTMPGVAPSTLDVRMALELNMLDAVGESLLQVDSIERTRAVAMAQQETVALAQVLKARQQSLAHEVAAAKLKAGEEHLEAARSMAIERQLNAVQSLIGVASDATATLRESARSLTSSHGDMTRATTEAVRQIAETNTLILQRYNDDQQSTQRMLVESAATAAVSAVTDIMHKYRLERPYDRDTAVSRSAKSTAPKTAASSSRSPGSSSARSDLSSARPEKIISRSSTPANAVEVESLSARSDRLARSERSSSRGSGQYSDDFEDLRIGSAEDVVESDADRRKKKPKLVSPDSSEVHTATDLSNKSTSAISESQVNTATDQSQAAPAGRNLTPDTARSAQTAVDSSVNDTSTISSVSEESLLTSPSVRRLSAHDDHSIHSEKNYTMEYDSSDATVVDDDELERSLREIVPSEVHRKHIRNKHLLETPPKNEAVLSDGVPELHLGTDDDSFTRFNVAMVQQYFREEAIHQQHKHTMLLLRESALKEKMVMELAWLEQQKQQLRDKGSDDRHPDILKKQKNIMRSHQRCQQEIRRLQKASKLSLEAQQLMMKESHDIAELRKITQQVKAKLREAGIEPIMLSSPDVATTDEDVSLHNIGDAPDTTPRNDDDKLTPSKDKTPKLKLDKKYLTSREQQLRERRRRLSEQQDLQEQLKMKQDEIKRLEAETGKLQKLQKSKKQSSTSLRSDVETATSIATDDQLNTARSRQSDTISEDILETSYSRKRGSLSEDLPGTARSKHLSSVTEEVGTENSSFRAAESRTKSVVSEQDSGSENSSVSEEIDEKDGVSSEASHAAHEYSHDHFDSETEQTATKPVTVSESVSLPVTKGSKSKDKSAENVVRQRTSFGDESDGSLNRSDLASDHSDLEKRIKVLNDQLRSRKLEAEKLKREHRRQRKMKLKAEEQALKQQIESYEAYIRRVKAELQNSPSTPRQASAVNVEVISKRPSSDSSASEQTVVRDLSRHSKQYSERFESSRQAQHQDDVNSDSRIVNSANIHTASEPMEDVQTAADDASSLKLDLDHVSVPPVTPRVAPDSARTLADVPEDILTSAPPTARDESDGTRHTAKPLSSIASKSAGVSYSEDFSAVSAGSGNVSAEEKGNRVASSVPSHRESHTAEESVPTEDEFSASLSDEDEKISSAVRSIHEAFNSSVADKSSVVSVVAASASVNDPVSSDNGEGDKSSANKPDSHCPSPALQDCQKFVTMTTTNLLSEAIAHMIDIKMCKAKQQSSSDDVVELSPSVKPAGSDTDHAASTHNASVQTPVHRIPVSTSTPFDTPNEEIDDIYEELSSMKSDDGWLSSLQPMKLALPEPIQVIPHNREEVTTLIDSAVDVLWPQRHDTKSWDALRTSCIADTDAADTSETRSRAAYQRLVYDLTAQAISELYTSASTTVDVLTQPWRQPKLSVRPAAPQSAEAAKPQIRALVLRHLRLDGHRPKLPRFATGARGRRRADRVDELLWTELREEEDSWTDYTNDELFVKMQLADVLFDVLLLETASSLPDIVSNKNNVTNITAD